MKKGPFKMKGMSFKSSPVKQKPGGSVGEALDHYEKYKANKMKAKDMVDTKRAKTHMVTQKNLPKSSGWSKAMKFGGKLLGTIGLLHGGDVSATAGSTRKKSEGEQIKDLLTKHKLKGGR
mgnify:CR=1 FL=1